MMNKHEKTTLVVSATAVGVSVFLAVLSRSLTKYLVSVALDRESPKMPIKTRKRLTGTKTVNMADEKLPKIDDKLEDKCEKIEIEGFDGEKLVGHWYRAENEKRVIIAMHGWRSSWKKDFAPISDFWHKNDCSVLYAEQRGQNESGGGYIGFGLTERFDCYGWIKWVEEKTGGKVAIYLGGVSMGAATVLMTAGFELPKCVKGIVADCGYTSPCDIWKHVLEKNIGMSYNVRKKTINKLCAKKLKCNANDYSATEAMRECNVPVLFIHGTADSFVPIEMTYENYKACKSKKRLFIVPGAEHAMSYFVDKDGYEEALKNFWQECENTNA